MKKERREAIQQKRRRQQQQLYLIIGVVVVLVTVVAIVLFMMSRTAEIPEGVADKYAGIEQSEDSSGYPRLGSASAPITVVEYSSFGCSHCKTFHEEQLTPMLDYIRNGQVQVIFKPITFIANNPNNDAGKAARAAICAGEQGKFWEMHSIVFNWQGNYSINESRVTAAGEELGLDTDALAECYGSNQADRVIASSEREFRDAGYDGTPVILVNGNEVGYPSTLSQVESLIDAGG